MEIIKKTFNIIENKELYKKVLVDLGQNKSIEYWLNSFGEIDRANKPAFILRVQNRIRKKIYFKNGKLHSYNDKPAYEYNDLSFSNSTKTRVWFKNGLIHRESNPAISIKDMYNNYILKGFFHNGRTTISQNGSFIRQLSPDYTEYFFLKDNKTTEGFNYFNYSDNKLSVKKRLHVDLNDLMNDFYFKITKDIVNENYNEEYFLNVVTFLSLDFLKVNTRVHETEEYYGFPTSINLEKDKFILEWRDGIDLHRKDKPARITYSRNSIIEENYINGKSLNCKYTPFLLTYNRKDLCLLNFKFKNSNIQDFYSDLGLDPLNLDSEDKELIDLNFSS